MFKVENFRTRSTTSIVHDALGQDTDQGALPRVDITDHSDPHVVLLSDRERAVKAAQLLFKVLALFFLFLLS